MCGIFGGIGKVNPFIFRALALANRERGTDSVGFWTPANSFRRAGDTLEVLSDTDCIQYITKASKAWFLAGHTRCATRGAATKRNAHPFRYGRIVGAHNGIVDAPASYAVDSMYLFDLLNKGQGDYKVLADVAGYWGLSWFDGQNFWLQAHHNEIAICRLGSTWYYSSDWAHLLACVGKAQDETILEGGATLRFDCKGVYKQTKNFQSNVTSKWWAKTGPVTPSIGATSASLLSEEADNPDPFYVGGDERERDRDWEQLDDWADYANQYD